MVKRAALRLTDSAEYANLLALLPGGVISSDLAAAARLRAAVDELLIRLMLDARDSRYTWEEIGQPLGMTRQGAQQLAKRGERNER